MPLGSQQVHYLEKGKDERHVILIHGFAAHTFTWRHEIEVLAARGYHVWAIDLLGFGFSSKPLNIEYSLDLYVDQVLAFMDGMHIEQAHIIGHSMGGAVSLGVAVRAQERLRSLVLIDSAGYPLSLPILLSLGKNFGGMVAPFMNRFAVQHGLEQIMYDKSKITEDQIDAYWVAYQTHASRQVSVKVLQAFEEKTLKTLSAHYFSLRCPMWIGWGEKDSWIPLSHLDRYLQDVPHAKIEIFSNCGHAPQEEQPEIFNRKLLQFLDEVESAIS